MRGEDAGTIKKLQLSSRAKRGDLPLVGYLKLLGLNDLELQIATPFCQTDYL